MPKITHCVVNGVTLYRVTGKPGPLEHVCPVLAVIRPNTSCFMTLTFPCTIAVGQRKILRMPLMAKQNAETLSPKSPMWLYRHCTV